MLNFNNRKQMFKFFRKKNDLVWRNERTYYYKDGVLYQAEMRKIVDSNDLNLTRYEYFKKYGVEVCEYSIELDFFTDWDTTFYTSIDDFLTDGMEEIISEDCLDDIIKSLKVAFKKKFEDFPFDGTLYRCKSYDFSENQCFRTVAMIKKKLIDEERDLLNDPNALILEIEVLDGNEATTKRQFITFTNFLNEYVPGAGIKVIDSGEKYHEGDCIENYFDLM